MKKNEIYPEGTFEDIVSFPFNTERIVAIVCGVVLLSGIFFLTTTDNESMAPKKFTNEKVTLGEIWTEDNMRSFGNGCSFCFPYNFSDGTWNVEQSPKYDSVTKQFIPNETWKVN